MKWKTAKLSVKKTTSISKQNPIFIGYNIVSESEDVLESGQYESPLVYKKVDWFVDEVMKLEKKMNFYFKKRRKTSL